MKPEPKEEESMKVPLQESKNVPTEAEHVQTMVDLLRGDDLPAVLRHIDALQQAKVDAQALVSRAYRGLKKDARKRLFGRVFHVNFFIISDRNISSVLGSSLTTTTPKQSREARGGNGSDLEIVVWCYSADERGAHVPRAAHRLCIIDKRCDLIYGKKTQFNNTSELSATLSSSTRTRNAVSSTLEYYWLTALPRKTCIAANTVRTLVEFLLEGGAQVWKTTSNSYIIVQLTHMRRLFDLFRRNILDEVTLKNAEKTPLRSALERLCKCDTFYKHKDIGRRVVVEALAALDVPLASALILSYIHEHKSERYKSRKDFFVRNYFQRHRGECGRRCMASVERNGQERYTAR